MAKFFSSWAMWEKLCFILACAILVTLCLGCAKLAHTHWKLRKYSALAEKEKLEQAVHRQMSVRSQRRRHADDVPFGIRAIESGIEVEGVWISRSNTPEPVSRESSANTSVWDHTPRKDPLPDLERQSFIGDKGRIASDSTLVNAGRPSSTFDRKSSGDLLASSRASAESTPEIFPAKPPRSRLPPPTLAKYSNSPYLAPPSSTATTVEGINAIYQASGPMLVRQNSFEPGDDCAVSSAASSGASSNSGEPIAASAPSLLTAQSRPRHSSLELDMMHSHRVSQAAEIGQLAPRTRKPGNSGDWASSAKAALSRVSLPPMERTSQQQQRSASPRKQAPPSSFVPADSASTSPVAAPQPTLRRSSMPEVTPFAQFCQTAPTSPRFEPTRRSSSESSNSSILGNSLSSLEEPVTVPSAAAPSQSTSQSESKRPSFEKRKSDILRGGGSGFEILIPGSLNPAPPAEQGPEKLQKAPPVSLKNYDRSSRSSSAESRRRLQKKRRPSVGSQSSQSSGEERRLSGL